MVTINAADWAFYMRKQEVRGLFIALDRSSSADVILIPNERLRLDAGDMDPATGKPLAAKKDYVLEITFQLKGATCPPASKLDEEIHKCVPPTADEGRILTLLLLTGGAPPEQIGDDITDEAGGILGKYLAPLAIYPKSSPGKKRQYCVPGNVEVIIPNRVGLISLVGEDLAMLLWPPAQPEPAIPGTPENKIQRAIVTEFTSPPP